MLQKFAILISLEQFGYFQKLFSNPISSLKKDSMAHKNRQTRKMKVTFQKVEANFTNKIVKILDIKILQTIPLSLKTTK